MVGDAFKRRDIRIKRTDNTVHTIEVSHRSYDALQYPLIFWEGGDEYHLNIKQKNPATGKIYTCYYLIFYFYARLISFCLNIIFLLCRSGTSKKVSVMNS